MTAKSLLPTLVLGIALTGAATARPQEAPTEGQRMVVVDSHQSALKRGTVIDSAQPLRLEAGATVVLMTESGDTVAIRGPHDGPPHLPPAGDSEAGVFEAVLTLIRPQATSGVPGGIRGGPDRTPDDIWAIDPSADGRHCLPEGTAATLWRAQAGTEAALEIWGAGGEAELWWAPDEQLMGWPDDLPLEDGARYELQWRHSPDSVEICVRRLPAGQPEGARLLVPLTEQDCRRQARALLGRLAAAAAAGPDATERR